MNFLIITDSDKLFEATSNQINELEKTAKTIKADFTEESIKSIKDSLDTVSLCIIFSENKKDFNTAEIVKLSALCGYLVATHISIITNIEFIANNNVFTQSPIKSVSSESELITFIKNQYAHISSDDEKRMAKKMLLDRGIPFTPDCFALYIGKNKPDIFDLFISAGVDINARDELGTPMLNIAVRSDNEDFAKRIIELGADINPVSDDRGYTPLMDAVWRGNEELTKLLIEKGADLNTISKEGQNNLVLAVGADRDKIVKLLADNGADPDVKDMMGMSAYGYATLFKKEKIVEILKPYHKE